MKTIPAKSILQKNKSGAWFGNDYNMNLYKGCCHGCIYCDSRSDCYNIDNFDEVRAKENALEILRDELKRRTPGIIGTGSMSDPYNPFEKTEQLSRRAAELIRGSGFGLTVVTKSSLITRDIDVFGEIAAEQPLLLKMTVTTADDRLCRLLEPNVAPTSERFAALEKLASAGLFTGITLMPILPFINDTAENIRSIVRRAGECGVRTIFPFFGLTLRDGQREYFYSRLSRIFPEKPLAKMYSERFGGSYECVSPRMNELCEIFREECHAAGILYRMDEIVSAYMAGNLSEQTRFF